MIQDINLGSAPNDKTGDKARVAGQKINANFAYLEAKIDNKSYIKVETGFTLVAQDLTFNADWEWMINNIDYTNPSSVVINIPFAASGKSRIDLIVCNSSNTFNRVAGIESVSTPVAPPLPVNTVLATFFTISDGSVGIPEPPVLGANYIEKREQQPFQVWNSGEINNTYLDDFYYGYLNFRASVTNLKSILGYGANIWNGKEILIKNSQTTDIIIYHLTGDGFQFSFPNEVNFVLKPNEIIRFSMKIITPTEGVLEYVGIIASNTFSGTTNDVSEGSTNKYFTEARVRAVILTGISFVTGGAITAADSILVAFGKLQKQISDNATAIASKADKTDTISLAMSDGTTALVTGDTDPFQAPYNFTLVSYWIGVKTAPTVSSLIVDVKKNGTSITSTKAAIDANEKTSLTGTSPVLTTTSFTKGDEITPNIYQVGSSETGRSLKLYLEIIKT